MRRVNCKKLTSFLFVCAHAYTLPDGILYLAMRYYTSYLDLYPNLTAPSFNSPVRFFRPSREHEQEGSYYDHRWLLIFRSRNTIFVLSQFIYFLENRLWPRSAFVDFFLRFFLLWISTSFAERKVRAIGRRRYIYRVTWHRGNTNCHCYPL